jgi:hypothetical protein
VFAPPSGRPKAEKSESRISKFETNSNFQIQMLETPAAATFAARSATLFPAAVVLNFVLWICFGFRASNFEFPEPPH